MKRLIPIILCVMLAFSVCVFGAETEENVSAPTMTEEFPMPEGMAPSDMQGGERMPGGRGGRRGGMPQGMQNGEEFTPPEMPDDMQAGEQTDVRGGGMMSENFQKQANMQSSRKGIAQFIKEYQTPIISVILLLLAFPFVIFYRRKNY